MGKLHMNEIVAAAIKRGDLFVTGNNHCDCIKKAIQEYDFEIPVYSHEQGFVDSFGIFRNRQEALEIAIQSGQVPSNFNKVLTSEDLW